MANKSKFNREQVVQSACQLFWLKGFSGTSTRDLQETINMRPGSVYAAFGSKEGLYAEALKCYSNEMKAKLDECLQASESKLRGLQMFVDKVLVLEAESTPTDVCMLVKASSEFCDENANLKKLSLRLLEEFELYLTQIFQSAQAQGELKPSIKACEYARFFQIQFIGIRNYLVRVEDKAIRQQLIKQMFNLLKTI